MKNKSTECIQRITRRKLSTARIRRPPITSPTVGAGAVCEGGGQATFTNAAAASSETPITKARSSAVLSMIVARVFCSDGVNLLNARDSHEKEKSGVTFGYVTGVAWSIPSIAPRLHEHVGIGAVTLVRSGSPLASRTQTRDGSPRVTCNLD